MSGTSETATPQPGESLWARQSNGSNAPDYCPHCGEEIALKEMMKKNDDLDRHYDKFRAYREHREAHYDWGVDPAEVYDGGDPFLATYYSAGSKKGDDDKDQDEIVGEVYDVEIKYEYTAKARVVAPSKARAKEKAEELRLANAEDLHGLVPDAHYTMKLHETADALRTVTRGETELAERMEGWPW